MNQQVPKMLSRSYGICGHDFIDRWGCRVGQRGRGELFPDHEGLDVGSRGTLQVSSSLDRHDNKIMASAFAEDGALVAENEGVETRLKGRDKIAALGFMGVAPPPSGPPPPRANGGTLPATITSFSRAPRAQRITAIGSICLRPHPAMEQRSSARPDITRTSS